MKMNRLYWARLMSCSTFLSLLKLRLTFVEFIAKKLASISDGRTPDFIVGSSDNPYLLRWFVIPRNPFFNIYLHNFRRSDDDRALHDHPWASASVMLWGSYLEHTIQYGGINKVERLSRGDIKVRWTGRFAHRIDLDRGDCWTVFLTGPRYRAWGFHCKNIGWVHWKKFTSPLNKGETGKGCDQ